MIGSLGPGETVKVIFRESVESDAFNNPVWTTTEETVDDVLVQPGELSDNISTVRPDGTDVKYTLYFPKTFSKKLERQSVEVRGEKYDVIGAPDYYDAVVCPTRWHMVVKVGVLHG